MRWFVGFIAVGCSSPSTTLTGIAPPGLSTPTTPTTPPPVTTPMLPDWVEPELGECARSPVDAHTARCATGVTALVDGVSHATVEDAVLAAPDDGTVWVCPGAHDVELTLDQRTLTLAGVDPAVGATVLKGTGANRLIDVITSTLLVDGLTLREGYGPGVGKVDWNGIGGAMRAFDSDVEVQCSTFTDNVATHGGGAIAAVGSRLALRDTELSSNMSEHFMGDAIVFSTVGLHGPSTWPAVFLATPELELDTVTITNHLGDYTAVWYQSYNGDNYSIQDMNTDYLITVVDSVFEGNTAGLQGQHGNVTIERSHFENNDVPFNLNLGRATVIDTDVVNNTNGIFLGSGPWGAQSFEMQGGSITDHTPTETWGSAAITLRKLPQRKGEPGVTMSLDGVTIHRNIAPAERAAVYVWGGNDGEMGDVELTITGCDMGSGKDDNAPRDVIFGDLAFDQVGPKDEIALP